MSYADAHADSPTYAARSWAMHTSNLIHAKAGPQERHKTVEAGPYPETRDRPDREGTPRYHRTPQASRRAVDCKATPLPDDCRQFGTCGDRHVNPPEYSDPAATKRARIGRPAHLPTPAYVERFRREKRSSKFDPRRADVKIRSKARSAFTARESPGSDCTVGTNIGANAPR